MTDAEKQKAKRDRLRAEGRCPRCGQRDPAWVEGKPHKTHCFACRVKVAAGQKTRWRAKVSAERVTGHRRCELCHVNPMPIIGRVRICAACRHLNAKARRALRQTQKVVDAASATE